MLKPFSVVVTNQTAPGEVRLTLVNTGEHIAYALALMLLRALQLINHFRSRERRKHLVHKIDGRPGPWLMCAHKAAAFHGHIALTVCVCRLLHLRFQRRR